MKLESEKAFVEKSQKACFDFLCKPENYKRLMPESTEKFELNSAGGFDFQLKGMPEIRMKMVDKHPEDKIILGSASEKFQFTLFVNIAEIETEKSQVQFLFEGNFNTMMAMMIKSPLKKFINTLSENLQKTH